MPSSNEIMGRPVFTRTQYDELKSSQRQLHDLLTHFDKAEQCGIDCTSLRGIAQETALMLEAIERNYMSPIPQ